MRRLGRGTKPNIYRPGVGFRFALPNLQFCARIELVLDKFTFMVWPDWHRLHGGKYQIVKIIGRGGFGITYKAMHVMFQQPAVIKTPNEELKFEPDYDQYIERFIREARLLAKLCQDPHPHIVRVSDLFEEADRHCLVMDFIDGESLWHLVQRRGALPVAEVLEYAKQIGSALSFIHQADLVHRDVTPMNIMLRNNGKAVLIDFGIAGEIIPTTIGTKYGNPAFAPYEQMHRGTRHPTADVYTLAASLYYAVTGQRPATSFERKLDDEPLVPPIQHNRAISDGLNQAILKGMALEAKDRPQSMREFLALFPQAEEDDLSSDQGVDYRNLRDLLKTGQWREADRETTRVMLKVSGREKEGWLHVEHIDNFPCTDLRTIDQLWVKYSNGRFGFSVQKRIYQSLGGTREYDEKIWEAFCDRVGWKTMKTMGIWFLSDQLTWNDRKAPLAHLPSWVPLRTWGWKWWWFGQALLSRRDL